MADYIVKDTELTSVANAIRTAGGTNSLLNFPNGFVSAVNNISGGSSDFSTAEVTITKTYEGTFDSYMAIIGTPEEDLDSVSIGGIEDGTFILPLYKGYNYIIVTGMPGSPTISVTGDIQWDLENGIFSVAGDGTITIS